MEQKAISKTTIVVARINQIYEDSITGDDVPEGWVSVKDYAHEEGVCRRWANEKLNTLVDKGLLERKQFRSPDGKTRNYYRPLDK